MASSRVRSRKPAKDEIYRFLAKPSPVKTVDEPLNLCLRDATSTVTPEHRPPSPGQSSRPPDPPAKLGSVTKRRKKRSTIFVPPEKLSNEVSICKFKFVAGNQPRLQEKKVLSLDSGGNFRFFPENVDTLTAKPVPGLLPIAALQSVAQEEDRATPRDPSPSGSGPSQDRITRKAQKRPSAENSFQDKGFLIQTQHVQATEGAVFCKFRQLKKFTRYLYRSWKHYLPEES